MVGGSLFLIASSASIAMSPSPLAERAFVETIVMGVYPAENSGIQLATGEYFCHPREHEMFFKDGHMISTTVRIMAAKTDKDYAVQAIGYWAGGADYGSTLDILCTLPPKEFDDAKLNLRSGFKISHVELRLKEGMDDKLPVQAKSLLHFHWNNDENKGGRKFVSIQTTRIVFELFKDQDTVEAVVEALKAHTKSVEKQLRSFGNDLRYLIFFYGGLIGVALLWLLLHH
jgi:hypothetical protein